LFVAVAASMSVNIPPPTATVAVAITAFVRVSTVTPPNLAADAASRDREGAVRGVGPGDLPDNSD
jgi:hypothetical protein